MSRQWRRTSPKTACISGGLLAVLCFPLFAEDLPTPASTPKPAETTAVELAEGESAAPSEKHLLAFKFRPDQVVRYEVRHETEMTTHFSGSTEIARNKSESRRAYKVTQVTPEGQGDLQLSIEWVHMTAQFDNGVSKTKPIEFQSDDPNKRPQQFQHILATIGPPQATIRFSPSGRPLKAEPLVPTPPSNTDPAKDKASPASGSVAAMAADASHENYLILLPEQPVAVGETWKDRFEIVAREPPDKIPVKITMQRSFKLTEIKEGRATIEFRTVILTPIQNPAISAQLMQRETTGKFVFDVEQGLIVSREATCDRMVVDALGPKSSTRAISKYQEKLLTVTATAGRDAPTETTSSKQ
jgi:hypothetical protein